jgi:hypothetical protein
VADEDLSLLARAAGYLLVSVCTVFPIGILAPLGYTWWLHGSAANELATGGVGAGELLGFLLVHPDVLVVSALLFALATRAFSAVGSGAFGGERGASHAHGVGEEADDDGIDGAGGLDAGDFDAGGFDGGE